MSALPLRATLLTLSLVMASVAPAGASHGTDDPNWVQHAGNGSGSTGVLIPGFQVVSAIYNGSRFPACSGSTCVSRGHSKYLAFGLKSIVINGQTRGQLHMVQLGDSGVHPQPSQPAVISDSVSGQDVPFTFSDGRSMFDVVYEASLQGGPFVIYYRGTPAETYTTSGLRRAVSSDGVHWTNETALSDVDAANPVISASRSSYGPTSVIIQSGSGISSTCTNAPLAFNFPWNCKYVMVYDAVAPSNHNIAITGSSNGLAFRGLPFQILSPATAGQWDDHSVTMGKVRKVAGGYRMFYSGAQAPVNACFAGNAGCWSIGVATSTNGLTWTRSPQNPVVRNDRYVGLGGATPHTLWAAAVVEDGADHVKIYISRVTNTIGRDTFLAYSAPAPAACPTIGVSSPKGGYLTNTPNPVEVFLNDTLGAPPGLDLSTLKLQIDGAGVPWASEDTMVGTYNNAGLGKRVFTTASQLGALSSGAHTFYVEVKDVEGNGCSVTTNFFVDRDPPISTVTSGPSGPVVAILQGLGTFTGTTNDAGIGLQRIRANVTNPIGQVKSYYSTDPFGWQVTQSSPNSWSWSFFATGLDPHFALPGEYRVSFLGQDLASNEERNSAANSMSVIVI